MDELKGYLLQQKKEMETLIEQATGSLKNAPYGSIRIAHKKNAEQYYWRTDPKDCNGIYIKKSEEKLIRDLAQKDYDQKILRIAKEKRNLFQVILKEYDQNDVKAVYENLSFSRQGLIVPYVLPDDKFIEVWEQEKKLEKQRHGGICFDSVNNDTCIITEKGECVRSKSEKILADKLYMMNIPYLYEVPLYLNGFGYIKPDFTVLNIRTRREYYWEHLGLMDQPDYCDKAIKKIELFEKNKIYPGEKLILTYETSKHVLNTRIVEGMIEEYLL